MIEAEWWEYDSLDELARCGCRRRRVHHRQRGRCAGLVADRGARRKTGPAIFSKLAAQKLPWKKVTIIPTDDRLVPMDDERSNVRESPRRFFRPARASSRSRPKSPTTGWRVIPPMPGCRICLGRRTSSGWAWARTGIPLRSLPGPTCRTRLRLPCTAGSWSDARPLPSDAPVARVTLDARRRSFPRGR